MIRWMLRMLLLLLLVPLTACGGALALLPSSAGAAAVPQWVCPTAELPAALATPTTDLLGPTPTAVPSATPYVRRDLFFLGQDVLVGGLRVTVHSVSGAGITHTLDLELGAWQQQPLDLARQVVIREVARADGLRMRGWWTSTAPDLPTQLAAGESWRGALVIRTPVGTPTLLAVFSSATAAHTPQRPDSIPILVRLDGPDPFCAGNIARSPLLPVEPGGPGMPPDRTPIASAPGSNPLVAFVVAHLGDPYVWGAKGPQAFDCSGLIYAAYRAVGITLPVGTTAPHGGQWATTVAIDIQALQPGDLLFFHTYLASPPPSHVGMYVGDFDGDGRGDMIHAANPAVGVVFQSNVFGSAYWQAAFMGARRVDRRMQ